MCSFIPFLSYQMNPANYREALLETAADEAEGADILLVIILFYITVAFYRDNSFVCCYTIVVPIWQVKPGLPYLDVIRLLRDNSALPIAAYQVSSLANPRCCEVVLFCPSSLLLFPFSIYTKNRCSLFTVYIQCHRWDHFSISIILHNSVYPIAALQPH